jgi:hypothetical protein
VPQVVGGAAAGGEWRGVVGKPEEAEAGVREEGDREWKKISRSLYGIELQQEIYQKIV